MLIKTTNQNDSRILSYNLKGGWEQGRCHEAPGESLLGMEARKDGRDEPELRSREPKPCPGRQRAAGDASKGCFLSLSNRCQKKSQGRWSVESSG